MKVPCCAQPKKVSLRGGHIFFTHGRGRMGGLYRQGHSREESTCLMSSQQYDQCVAMQPTPARQDHFLLGNRGFRPLLKLRMKETDERPTEMDGSHTRMMLQDIDL